MPILERNDTGAIARLTLNAPEKLNALSDAMLAALELNDSAARVSALEAITPEKGSTAEHPVLEFMLAAQQAGAEDEEAAAATLNGLATNGDVPEIYRQIAAFKALGLSGNEMPAAEIKRIESLGHSPPLHGLRFRKSAIRVVVAEHVISGPFVFVPNVEERLIAAMG